MKYFKYISIRKDWTTKHFANELFNEIFFKQKMLKFILFDKNSLFTFNFELNFCYHKNKNSIKYRFSFLNKWANKKIKLNVKTILKNICQILTK
jgi:hypothetical protein